jgi:predicted anti-sigma-YlaC factor YlaD
MADLTCQELVELVTDYLEGALTQDVRTRFDEHLAVCPGCETYLDQIRETASLLGEVSVDDITGEMRATLLSAFRDFHR